MRIQEIAEELVNLTVKEVNELAHILKYDMDQARCHSEISNKPSTPKDYGIKLYECRHKKRK